MRENSKILVLCQLFYPELVSTGQTVTELCETLSEKGHNITVWCAPPSILKTKTKKTIHHNNITIKRLWATQFPKLNTLGKLINHLTFTLSCFLKLCTHPKNIPILVFTNPPFLALIPALLNRTFIYVVFDVYPETAIACNMLSPKNPLSLLWKSLNRYIYTKATNIVVIGRCMQNVIAPHVDNPNKIHHIPVWADDKTIQSQIIHPNPLKEKWELTDKFIILYSGNLGRFHDLETIIESAKQLNKNTNIMFVFVGEGHQKQWLINKANQYQLNNCMFQPYVDRSQLGLSLSMADIGLVSLLPTQTGLSVPSKTFGLMAVGAPIIGILPNNSEISLILKEHACGIVTPPQDPTQLTEHILTLYQNAEKRKSLGAKGKETLEKEFSLTKTGAKFSALIKSTILLV